MQKPYIDNPYQVWMWIELIGFDNQSPDFGVRAFLDRAGFTPQIISLLFSNPDFVHAHDGTDWDGVFPNDYCSYGGHERNEERSRQPWAQRQLRQLVKELQKCGIKVYLSFFDFITDSPWTKQHPEIRYVTKDGEMRNCLCPWKRLADKSYYEDFFIQKLTQVMQDYGFDGLHGADGYNQPRLPIFLADFSDDLFEQFIREAAVPLPNALQRNCDGKPDSLRERADWIWSSVRLEYITFCVNRHQRFWRKVAAAMHEIGKRVYVNSAWTKDPFEAIYRYGTDYRKLIDAGVDGFISEAPSGALETLEPSKEPLRYLCDHSASNLLNKAYIADAPLLWLHGIKDNNENWNALRHAPTVLECEIHCLSNLFYWNADGDLNRCMSGLMTCLSDGIPKEDWRRLKTSWDLGFSAKPETITGATLIWSDHALQEQLKDYIRTRRFHVQQVLRYLIAMGAPIQSVADIDNLENVHGPIVCINLHLWNENERLKIFGYSNGPTVVIGDKTAFSKKPDFLLEDIESPTSLACGVYGKRLNFDSTITEKVDVGQSITDTAKIIEPKSWLDDLFFTDVSEDFWVACVKVIQECASGPKVVRFISGHGGKPIRNPKTVAITTVVISKNTLRLMIRNDNYFCVTAKIDVGKPIVHIEWLNPFSATKIQPEDVSDFYIRVPGRGVSVLDVEIQ